MINSILDFCRKVNLEINLFELIKGLSIIVLISVIVLVMKKIVYIHKKEREIDRRVKESSTRIARAIAEIEGYEKISKTEKSNKELSSTMETKKETKTRAMSMEERWAEYDKKRAIRNTA